MGNISTKIFIERPPTGGCNKCVCNKLRFHTPPYCNVGSSKWSNCYKDPHCSKVATFSRPRAPRSRLAQEKHVTKLKLHPDWSNIFTRTGPLCLHVLGLKLLREKKEEDKIKFLFVHQWFTVSFLLGDGTVLFVGSKLFKVGSLSCFDSLSSDFSDKSNKF